MPTEKQDNDYLESESERFRNADTDPGTAYELGRKIKKYQDERGQCDRESDEIVKRLLRSCKKVLDEKAYEELKALLKKCDLLKGDIK